LVPVVARLAGILFVVTDSSRKVTNSGAVERLQAWVREDFGVQLSSIYRVVHGADAAAEVWRGIAVDGSQYAVKWSGGGTDAGPLVTAHLAATGVPGILGPTKTRSGQLWSEREGRRLSLVPWISADRALDGGMTAQRWTSYGALLAKVHATEPAPALGAALLRDDYSNEGMAALTRSIDRRLRTARPADALEEELATTWKANYEVITGLLELSDELGRKLAAEDAPVVICHADPHLGNVLVGPADGVWLIDWDDAALAPREQDLMFVLGGMGEFGPQTAQERAWFFDGYGETQVDPTRLTYYRCARALEEVALWSEQVLQGPGREESLDFLRGVLSPAGLAVLALS